MGPVHQKNSKKASRKPRVAFIVHYVTDYRIPIYRELERRGHLDITLIHSSDDYRGKVKPATREKICENSISVKSYQFQLGKLNFVLQPHALSKVMADFDCVICQSGRSLITNVLILIFCKFRKIPFLWWTGSWEPIFKVAIYEIILKGYQRLLWRLADGAVVYNTEAKRKLMRLGISVKRIFVAQNTKDERPVLRMETELMTRAAELRETMGFSKNDKIVLFVGAITPEKRIGHLIEAFHRAAKDMKNWHLIIVGDGPHREHLENVCKKNIIPRVIFTGRIINDIYAYFMMCDIFVLPSLGGLALNDAMMCHKPVICGEADGTEKDLVIDGVTGYLLRNQENNRVQEIANRITFMLTNEEKAKKMGENAFMHYLKTCSFEKMVEAFERASFECI